MQCSGSICESILRKRWRERRCRRDILGKALRVIPRGKQRLTVYRAHQVWLNLVSEKIAKVDHKNEEIDIIYEKKSLRSNFPGCISSWPIQKCIRCIDPIVLGSISVEDNFLMTQKNRDFHENMFFSREYPGYLQEDSRMHTECLRVRLSIKNRFLDHKISLEKNEKFRDFPRDWYSFFVRLLEFSVLLGAIASWFRLS